LAQADQFNDDYLEAEFSSEKDELKAKSNLQGKKQVISDIVGLVAFMNSFKVIQPPK
jgi:hypothetical protein